jgi:hypothetical protein
VLVEFRCLGGIIGYMLKCGGSVEIQPEAAGDRYLPMLVALGWYLLFLVVLDDLSAVRSFRRI